MVGIICGRGKFLSLDWNRGVTDSEKGEDEEEYDNGKRRDDETCETDKWLG